MTKKTLTDFATTATEATATRRTTTARRRRRRRRRRRTTGAKKKTGETGNGGRGDCDEIRLMVLV